jgi:hypothetical protein
MVLIWGLGLCLCIIALCMAVYAIGLQKGGEE